MNDNIIKLGGEDDGQAKLLKIRYWLTEAVRRNGVEVEGAGIGIGPDAGTADFDFELGKRHKRHYWVHISEVEVDADEAAARRQTYPNLVELCEISKWLTDAMTAHGVLTLTKVGLARAVFDFELGGRRYWVNISEVELEPEDVGEAAGLGEMEVGGTA